VAQGGGPEFKPQYYKKRETSSPPCLKCAGAYRFNLQNDGNLLKWNIPDNTKPKIMLLHIIQAEPKPGSL
jgi:hypothetical protein